MEKIGRTIAFPGVYISMIGALLVILGAALPAGSMYYSTRANVRGLEGCITIVGGALRPSMVLLPAQTGVPPFEIAERKVTAANFFRVIRGIPAEAVVVTGGSSADTCPALMTRNEQQKPILGVTPLEAATYANALTQTENELRRASNITLMTPCYRPNSLQLASTNCTGYRLPTVAEWSYAAAPWGGVGDTDTSSSCPSSAWFIEEMCDIPEMAIAAGSGPAVVVTIGAVGGSTTTPLAPADRRPIGFRLVRSLAEAGDI